MEHRLFGTVLVVARKYRPSAPSGVGRQWNVVVVGGVSDTLLGPEGSGDTGNGSPGRLLVQRVGVGRVFVWPGCFGRGPRRGRSFAVSGVGCRLYFENFTVDASIFVVSSF